jgi:hypothetical protein
VVSRVAQMTFIACVGWLTNLYFTVLLIAQGDTILLYLELTNTDETCDH